MQTNKKPKARQIDENYLAECLTAFFRETLPDIQRQYKTDDLNIPFLKKPLSALGDNDFQRNHALRKEMSTVEADPKTKPFIRGRRAVWYVEKWGRLTSKSRRVPAVRAHRRRLAGFAHTDPAILIGEGTKGIASWSKVLAYRCYHDRFVYDARVASCLNAIQITHGTGILHRFGSLGTMGAPAEAFQRVLKNTGDALKPAIPTKDVYELYCRLLLCRWAELSDDLKTQAVDWQGLEMTLFHHSKTMIPRASEMLDRLDFYNYQVAAIKKRNNEQARLNRARKKKLKEASLG